jgi:hypothetical protein
MTLQNDPGNTHDPAARPGGNGMAVAGLVLGITSILFCWWGLFSLAQIILAIVFSGAGIRQANQGAGRKGMAVAGLACGVTGCLAYLAIGIASLGVGFLV